MHCSILPQIFNITLWYCGTEYRGLLEVQSHVSRWYVLRSRLPLIEHYTE
jgi:hypothetical protein